jgi:hypothetical protein
MVRNSILNALIGPPKFYSLYKTVNTDCFYFFNLIDTTVHSSIVSYLKKKNYLKIDNYYKTS